jgi:hypothetical protein
MVDKFPYVPVSKFHAALKAQFEAVSKTPVSIDALTREIHTGGGTKGAIEDVAKAIRDRPDTTAIEDKLDEIFEALQALGRRDTDNVTALYAAAVDTSGDIVGRTIPGQWLNKANYSSLQDIADPRGGESNDVRRSEFIKQLHYAADGFKSGLPAVMTDEEIGRFFDLAPATLKAIVESQEPRPPTAGKRARRPQSRPSPKKRAARHRVR